MPRSLGRAALLGLALILAQPSTPQTPAGVVPPGVAPDGVILFTGDVVGYIEPCG